MKRATYEKIEEKHGKPLSEILIDAFEKHGNQTDVAKSLGVSQPTISLWLKWLNLTQHTVLRPADDPHQKVL